MLNAQKAFQIASILLQYPEPEWTLLDELREEVEHLEMPEVAVHLQAFLDFLEATDLVQLAEQYVRTFDFNSKTNLYLTYGQLGEERERGQTLVELKRLYNEAGFVIYNEELPDYVPLYLEFLSIANEHDAKQLIARFTPALEHLHSELAEMKSPYAHVLQACLLASAPPLRGCGFERRR